MKTSKLAIAVTLALGMSGGAQAYLFDPDGGGSLAVTNIASLDWSPTSFLALGGNTAIANYVGSTGACTGTTCQFDVLTHATLAGYLVSGSDTPLSWTGLNSTFEITMIASFTEQVTGVSVVGGLQTATFTTVTTEPMFLQIYFDTTPDSAALSGSGFDDGQLILSGTLIGSSSGGFFITDPTPVPLDGTSDGNQYDGQNTITGTGSQANIAVDSLSYNNLWFTEFLQQFGIQYANISIGLPYISVNPSDCFNVNTTEGGCDTDHNDGLMSTQTAANTDGVVPDIGPLNGGGVASGPDFMAQTDYNSPLFPAAVPEPGSLALLALGVGALGVSGLRRRRGLSA